MPVEQTYYCRDCGGIMDIKYDYSAPFAKLAAAKPDTSMPGIWKYRELLPVRDPANMVSLGEGDTPLLAVPRVAGHWDLDLNLMIKAEMLNPSGSFKDRPTAVGVSAARENGFEKVVLCSSGNASASAAAYAARAGMECIVFIPAGTDINKVVQAQAYGSRVFCVEGPFSNAFRMAVESAGRYGWANVTSTFMNPFTVEGDKTPAYEFYSQLQGDLPDYILIPISAGPLLVGMYKGFMELMAMGLTERVPALVGVQARACEPIVRAIERGAGEVKSRDGTERTKAGRQSDPQTAYDADGTLTLSIIRRTGGMAVSLDEDEIREATSVVERMSGLYSEPSGAISVGAAAKLFRMGALPAGSRVACMVTGHGFKFSGRNPEQPPLVADLEDLEKVL